LRAEHLNFAHAVDAADRVLELRHDHVGQVVGVMRIVVGIDADDDQEVRGRLGDLQPLALYFLRQQRGGGLQLVLHLDLRDVRVGALFERQRDRQRPRGRGRGREIAQVVDPAQLLLDHLRGRAFQRFGIGARIHGVDRHRGRRDFRELRDRQAADRDRARQHEHDRDDPCEDGPIDEKA
jgi:hypothetical protein